MKVKLSVPTSTLSKRECKDPIPVERRLRKVCKKLNVTEVNIGLFHRMIKNGVMTNDVRSFAENQQLKSSGSTTSKAVARAAMKRKLTDACSTAGKLRREKKFLRMTLMTECMYSKSKTKREAKCITSSIGVLHVAPHYQMVYGKLQRT